MNSQTGEQPEQMIELKHKKPIIYIHPIADTASAFQQIVPPRLQPRISSTLVENNNNNQSSFLSKIVAFLKTDISPGDLLPLAPYLPGMNATVALLTVFDKISKRGYQSDASHEIISEEDKQSVNIATILLEQNLSQWKSFVESIPYSSLTQDYEFPPGHPLIGRFYRVHPLKSKSRYYIPIEVFDSLLYSERENELIRILVDLGATKISIQEISSGKTEGTAKAGVNITGAGGVSSDITGRNESSNTQSRITLLRGKNWTPDMEKQFDRTQYSWLPYEPAWEAIVHARLKGGCLSSSVELASNTSYSVTGQLGLTEGLIENLASFEAGGNFARLRKEKQLFVVEFADVLPNSATI